MTTNTQTPPAALISRKSRKTLAIWLAAFCGAGAIVSPARSIRDLNYPHPMPAFITAATTFGERPDWASDGKRIAFLDKTCGDVWEVDLITRELTPLTHHYHHAGYTRALYLANGDLLLSGARFFDPQNPGKSRHESGAELWVLRPGSGRPATPLGAFCREGPSVSRTRMRIAWAVGDTFRLADIANDDEGTPRLDNDRVVLRHADLPQPDSLIEAQDFRPGAEHELLFNIYTKRDNYLSETYGLDLRTGKLTDYSRLPDRYSEPEGVFPDGRHILVESSRHAHNYKEQKNFVGIDLYILALDGSGAAERLTFFNDDPRFKASQGVISPDGRYMAFQISKTTDETGYGYGIMLMDLPAYMKSRGIGMPGKK
jgi:hypothetical protein